VFRIRERGEWEWEWEGRMSVSNLIRDSLRSSCESAGIVMYRVYEIVFVAKTANSEIDG